MTNSKTRVARPRKHKYWPVLALIVCNALIGLLIFRDYGLTVDEPWILDYAQHVLDSYRSIFAMGYAPFRTGSLDNYGPAYFAMARLFANLGERIFPALGHISFWHLAGFLFFQLAVFCIYKLSLRWMDPWGALGAALLFSTQPLLWGHAFINPKDSPFLVLFLASITFGLAMADRILGLEQDGAPKRTSMILGYQPEISGWKPRKRLLMIGLATFIGLLPLAGLGFVLRRDITGAVLRGIHSLGSKNLDAAMTFFAQSSSGEALKRVLVGSAGSSTKIGLLIIVLAASIWSIVALFRAWPEIVRWATRGFLVSLADPSLILAGVLLGLSVSVRVLGPFAGALVMLWMLLRAGWRVIPAIWAYSGIAALVAYLSWPFLWADPFGRFVESIKLMSSFPWLGRILFEGTLYTAKDLPRTYIPTLMAVQLTEPVWILFSLSIILIGYRFIKTRSGLDLILLLLCWLVMPVLILVATRRPIYDNIRQLHFLLPPIFVSAGVAISFLANRLRSAWIRAALLVAVALPGIVAIVQLHPYEYVYYNHYVGGQRGAFRDFEPDYWLASATEAARYVNRTATPGSTIFIAGPISLLKPYVRKDLKISSFDPANDVVKPHDYVLVPTRNNLDLRTIAGNPTVYEIIRGGMPLMLIKKASPSP